MAKVLVTGANRGIGLELCRQLAARGEEVIAVCRNSSAELDALGARVVTGVDVASGESVAQLARQLVGMKLDWLINNAGISQRDLCVDTDLEVYRNLLEVDVLGQIALTKCVLPLMQNRGSGHIAVTSSVAGKIGAPYRTGYCAAKHAVMGFFDALRAEVARQGIRVTTITPGFVQTDISVNALRGDGTNEFWRYDIAGDLWEPDAVADLPATALVGDGGALVSTGSLLYALEGNGTNNFWRYDIANDLWSAMS